MAHRQEAENRRTLPSGCITSIRALLLDRCGDADALGVAGSARQFQGAMTVKWNGFTWAVINTKAPVILASAGTPPKVIFTL